MRFFVTLLCAVLVVASASGQASVRGRPARSAQIKLAVQPFEPLQTLELEPQLAVEPLAVEPTLLIKNPGIVPAVLPIADTKDFLPQASAGKRRIVPFGAYPRYWPDYVAPTDNWYGGWNSAPRYWNGPRSWRGFPRSTPYWPRRRLLQPVASPIAVPDVADVDAVAVDDGIVSDVVPVPIPEIAIIPEESATADEAVASEEQADPVMSTQVIS